MDVARTLNAAVDRLQAAASGGNSGGAKVVLVLDQPDVLLAAAGAGDGVTSASLRDVVLDLREVSLGGFVVFCFTLLGPGFSCFLLFFSFLFLLFFFFGILPWSLEEGQAGYHFFRCLGLDYFFFFYSPSSSSVSSSSVDGLHGTEGCS